MDLALRRLVGEPLSLDEVRSMEGSGWDGDLDEMRSARAWVEFLRGTGSEANVRVRELVERDELVTTDVVLMELLAGARDGAHRNELRGLLARCEFAPTVGPTDYEAAADLYRTCRGAGHTVRSLTDCLIASVAIRRRLPLLHADTDFDMLARHTPLEIA